MALIKYLFEKEKKPRKGLLAVEWVIMGYLLLTTIIILFTYTKAINPESMLWGRFRIAIMTLALWGVYRMMPCRFTHFCRLGAQLALLSWWYPDTFEINRIFPNLDPAFASYEQQLFGCQPSLLFSQVVSSPLFSELMIMGYAAYSRASSSIMSSSLLCPSQVRNTTSWQLASIIFPRVFFLTSEIISVPTWRPCPCQATRTCSSIS